jgi:Asp-tRNA(Asn)/Glu-tRNA(Gln) amidotransferase A subunit family amidase
MVQYCLGKNYTISFEELHENQTIIRKQLDQCLGDLDGWILPVNPMPVPDHNLEHKRVQIEDRTLNYWIAMGYYCWPFSVSGHPVASIRYKEIGELPLGIQVVGHYNEDDALMRTVQTLYQSFHP